MQVEGYFRYKDSRGDGYHYCLYRLGRDDEGKLRWYPPGEFPNGNHFFHKTLEFAKDLPHPFIRDATTTLFTTIPYLESDLCQQTSS